MRGRTTVFGSAVLLLSACGGGATPAASPTPTPISVLAQEYKNAADKANKVIFAIDARLEADCKMLAACKADFAQLSQAENGFIAALRAMKPPPSMEADRRAVLDIERRRLSLVDDAAQATSLDQINSDYNSLSAIESQFEDAIDHMRLDLGLPAAPTSTPTTRPSTSA